MGKKYAIQFGCQTYTWQMSYAKYKNSFADILDTIKASGFRGVEAEVCMLGSFYEDPGLLMNALSARGLELAALTLALPWLHSEETEEEQKEADRLISYLGHFPQSKLILVQLPGKDRSNLTTRRNHALQCVNAVAERASGKGINCAFHPNSSAGSVFRTGDGVIDHPGLTAFLHQYAYNGWIMVEEESEQAEKDPDKATMLNGIYTRKMLHDRAT